MVDDYEKRKQEHFEEIQRREQSYLEELEARRQEEQRRRRVAGLAKVYAKKKLGPAAGRLTKAGGKAAGRALAAGARAAAAGIGEAIAAAAPAIGTVLLVIAAIVGITLLILIILTVVCNAEGLHGTLVRWASTAVSPFAGSDVCKFLSKGFGGIVTTLESGGADLYCKTPEYLAQQNNTPYPRKNDPDLDRLISCIVNSPQVGGTANTGEVSSFDKSHESCNYTRGQTLCEQTCSHSQKSCHYGGATGTAGALAADFGNEKKGPEILKAAKDCSSSLGIPLNRSTCENAATDSVACSNPGADHVHISLGKCDQDNGPININ
jgi:hypothetical protein